VYGAYTFGPAGKRVKVILLDVRYNPDDTAAPDRDILGEEQWQWFERELRESDAQINVVGSGIQVLPRDKPVQEKWANFPRSLARLEKTLQLSYVLRPLLQFSELRLCPAYIYRERALC
jgi:alkaline phosphatase D